MKKEKFMVSYSVVPRLTWKSNKKHIVPPGCCTIIWLFLWIGPNHKEANILSPFERKMQLPNIKTEENDEIWWKHWNGPIHCLIFKLVRSRGTSYTSEFPLHDNSFSRNARFFFRSTFIFPTCTKLCLNWILCQPTKSLKIIHFNG